MNRRDFLGVVAATRVAARGLPAAAMPVPSAAEPGPAAILGGRNPWLEINAAHLEWNLRQVERRAGKPVMAVIKANGYGHGLVECGRALAGAGAKHFLVAKLDEARRLREAGVGGLVLNFGPFSPGDADEIVRLTLSQNVYTDDLAVLAEAARRRHTRAHVHVKIDTGLGRFGVPHDGAVEFLKRVARLPDVVVDGVFTTFTEDPAFDPMQLERFHAVCNSAKQAGIALGVRHAASSAAIVDFPAASQTLDMVRPGIMLYGLYPSEQAERDRKLDLKPALVLKTRVAQVKTLRKGESVSYHRPYTAKADEPVATLAVGYADGFPRDAAGRGAVLVGGRRCPILAVTSNAAVVRLDGTSARPGDEAVLIGPQGGETIDAAEVARWARISVYALVIGMSALLPRVML